MTSLGVVIPALNAAASLTPVLDAVRSEAGAFDLDVVVVDGGSQDDTRAVAAGQGARVVESPRGRGAQLSAGAMTARGDWLLFLHADTVLEPGWAAVVARFIGEAPAERAGFFRFTLDDHSTGARRLERMVAWRCRVLGLPYGDQGLLVARKTYDQVGGYRPLVLMEDVDLVRRLGRRNLQDLAVGARTSAERFRREGYIKRSTRNLICLSLYFAGLPPQLIARLYG